MANYQSLKAAINAVIKANGNKEITGTVLNEVLLAMVNSLGAGYQFAGVAAPSTVPGTPDQKVFYIASQAGTYTNFGGAVVSDGIVIFEWNGTWTTETLDLSMAGQVQSDWTETDTTKKSYIKHKPNIPPSANVDPVPTNGSPNAVASGGVYNAIKAITDFLNNGYYFVGIAVTSTVPDSVTQYGIFYIASDGGTYTNFLNGDDEPLTLYQGLNILYKDVEDDGWNYFEVFKFSDFVDTTQQQSLSSQQKVQAQNNMMGKAYAPAQNSGFGKVYLAKNNGVLTQSMMQAANTVYVIQYDFTLDEDITVPANCVLEFDGGSISGNGTGKDTITGNNTAINAGLVKIFNINVTLAGTWNVVEAYPEWFGAKGDGVVDDTNSVQKAVSYFRNIKVKNTYKCTSVIYITHDYTKIEGSGTFIFTTSLSVRAYNCDNITFKGFKIVTLSGYSGVGVWTGNESYVTNVNPNTKVHYENIMVDGIVVDNYSSGYRELIYGSHCVDIREWGGSSIKNITVQNCVLRGSGVDPNVLQSLDGSDNIYCGSYDSQAAPMENIKILNNICEYAGRNNLSLASSNTSCIKNAVVSGNLFKDSTMCGFDIEYASEIHCCNNKFIGCGKFTGYYDPADSAYHNNHILQSAICNTEAPDHFVSCTFDNCRTVGAARATLDDCVIKNTPMKKQDLTYYSVNLNNCYINMSELTGSSIVMVDDVILSGCNIILGESKMEFVYETIIDDCDIKYTGNEIAINVQLNRTKITNSRITAKNGIAFGTTETNNPQILIDNCVIEAYQLMGSLVYIDSVWVQNSNIVVNVLCQTWFNLTQDFYFRVNNNTISCKLPIGMPWTKLVELNNNIFDITGTYTPLESGWGDSTHFIFSKTLIDNCKVSVKDNIIKDLPTTTTNLVTERNQYDSGNTILDITGNVISGSGSQQIQVFTGKKSSTAASIIERNSYNGTDLVS